MLEAVNGGPLVSGGPWLRVGVASGRLKLVWRGPVGGPLNEDGGEPDGGGAKKGVCKRGGPV